MESLNSSFISNLQGMGIQIISQISKKEEETSPITKIGQETLVGTSLTTSLDFGDAFAEVLNPEEQKKPPLKIMIKSSEQDGFDLDEIDFFTQETFRESIQTHEESKIPYFVASWTHDDKKTTFTGARSFFRYYFNYKKTDDSITKLPITTFNIYKKSINKDHFVFFCNKETLQLKTESSLSHASKYIHATNLENLDSPENRDRKVRRGDNRNHVAKYHVDKAKYHRAVADIYRTKIEELRVLSNAENDDELIFISNAAKFQEDKESRYIEKARKWLELAIEDGNSDAKAKYAEWLWDGEFVEQDPEKALAFLKEVVHGLKMDSEDDTFLVNGYLDMIAMYELEFPDMPVDMAEKEFCIQLINKK